MSLLDIKKEQEEALAKTNKLISLHEKITKLLSDSGLTLDEYVESVTDTAPAPVKKEKKSKGETAKRLTAETKAALIADLQEVLAGKSDLTGEALAEKYSTSMGTVAQYKKKLKATAPAAS